MANQDIQHDPVRVVKFGPDLKSSYAEKLRRGGNCSATTNKGLPCPIHGDRLVDGQWLCHVHDPDGTMRKNLTREPDVDDQKTFDELVDRVATELEKRANAVALFTPSDDTQGRIASKRIKKWSGGKPA